MSLRKDTLKHYLQDTVNLSEKFQKFDECWSPKIVGQINNFHVKLFKAYGEFVWHSHPLDDEFFLVIKGQLNIKLPDREVVVRENEFFIVPKGVRHCPYASNEA